jgi:hypothetical protein
LKGKIEKNNNFSKRSKKRNQNNKDQIERYNTINLDWKIKLKTTKLLLRVKEKKTRNQKIRDQIGKYNICKLGSNDEIENK